VRTFVDPVRGEEWRVIFEMSSSGVPRLVFAREAVRLDPAQELSSAAGLSEERLRELFLSSYREFWHDDAVWQVRWQERENLETWTWFSSASGERRVVRAQIMFPFLSVSELADALTGASQATP
jgi:hypothetical protein